MKLSTRIATSLSRGFDAGNFANAYTSEDFGARSVQTELTRALFVRRAREQEAFRAGFVLGFFASYEDHEIPSEHFESFEEARSEWADHARSIGIAID